MIAKSSEVEIKSQLTGAIIKPYGKYLDINHFTPQNNHNRVFFVFIGNTCKICERKRRNKFAKKKTLLLESFSGLLNRVFPCFHCLSKTPPSHILNLPQRNFFRGREE